jgi:predicted transcriptional regulator
MIASAEWTVPADWQIIFFLSEHRLRFAAPPATVSANCDLSTGHANTRLGLLLEAGLVELGDERGYYRVTHDGIRWFNGEMTDEELRERDPRDDV